MNKEEFLAELGASEEAPNAGKLFELLDKMIDEKVNTLENKIMDMLRSDLSQLDRGLSVMEDRIGSMQSRIDNISYTLKKALQPKQTVPIQHEDSA